MFSKPKVEIKIEEKEKNKNKISYLGTLTTNEIYEFKVSSNNCIANKFTLFIPDSDEEVTFSRYLENYSSLIFPFKKTSSYVRNRKLDKLYPELYLRSEESLKSEKPVCLNKKYSKTLEKLISKYL